MKKLLIIVPYRDRPEHLKSFLEKTPKYFREQNIEFDIIICELENIGCWNAGLCCNSIIKYDKIHEYEYIYIHHVDIFPIRGDWEFPEECEAFIKLGDFGSCLTKTKNFLKAGGYSNSFWGWGGEDNDFYSKLSNIGVSLKENGNIQFDTLFQNHERKFNGLNYANTQNVLSKKTKHNDIFDFDEHAIVTDFLKIEENVYKQKLIPLKKSPLNFDNKKLVISYIKHVNKTNLMPIIKSALFFAPYEYDIAFCVADEFPGKDLINELEAFNIIPYIFKSENKNLCVDRFYAYKKFLKENKKYTHVLHVDATDVYFQSNPFVFVQDDLIAVSENVKIKDQNWNYSNLKKIYDNTVLNNIENNEVICCGVIGGSANKFINLCDLIIEEEKNIKPKNIFGVDQLLLQRIIYENKIDINILSYENAFCIHLHTFVESPERFSNININNTKVSHNNILYSIVHQYNRNYFLHKSVNDHYSGSAFVHP